MKGLSTWIGLVLVTGVTVLTGVVHGRLSNRWGQAPDMGGAAQRLMALPETIGDWEMRDSSDFSEGVLKQLQCAGYVNRVYVHRKTGDTVSMAALVGPPGPISVHTPEVCYPSMNLLAEGDAESEKIDSDGRDNEFYNVIFKSQGLEADRLRVWYAWSRGDGWSTPKLSPRVAFSGAPMLFKVQVASRLDAGSTREDHDACRDFISALVPVMNQTVFVGGAG